MWSLAEAVQGLGLYCYTSKRFGFLRDLKPPEHIRRTSGRVSW